MLRDIAKWEETLPLGEVNYFLFVVGVESIQHPHALGDCGIGRTSIRSGISDCRWGTMLIAPQEFVENRAREEGKSLVSLTPGIIEKYILEFFGHSAVADHLAHQKRIEESDTRIIRIDRDRPEET